MAAAAAGRSTAGQQASFAHLHVHTEYSMLMLAARLKDLSREQAGMPAIVITHHAPRRLRLLDEGHRRGHQAGDRDRGLCRARAPHAPPAGPPGTGLARVPQRTGWRCMRCSGAT